MIDTLRNFDVRLLFRNLCYLCTRDLAADMLQPELRKEALYQRIIHLPEPWASTFRDEIEYLKREGWAPFPYAQVRKLERVESGRDPDRGLPYVVHRGRRLYFPATWTERRAEEAYRGYVENECLLGGGYRQKAPHQYQTDAFRVQEGDVVVDIGAAEGLFALDVADQAGRIYLFECDPVWKAPLAATFAPFGDKVRIVNRRVGGGQSRGEVRLDGFLDREAGGRFFLKMDIEGAETAVVEACRDFLVREDRVRLCCCTYHRQGDAERLESLLNGMGYRTAFSDGYVLFSRDRQLGKPYFRRGLIRAEKQA